MLKEYAVDALIHILAVDVLVYCYMFINCKKSEDYTGILYQSFTEAHELAVWNITKATYRHHTFNMGNLLFFFL